MTKTPTDRSSTDRFIVRPPADARPACPTASMSPRMNCRTTGFAEDWIASAGPDSTIEALVEHGHAVGDAEDLRDLVAHHDGGEAELPVQFPDQVVDRVDEDGIEARGRLVEEDDLGLGHERPRDRHALAHAARDLRGVLVAHARQPDLLELLLHPAPDVGGGQPASSRAGERRRCPPPTWSRRGRRPGRRPRSAAGSRRGPRPRSRVMSAPSTRIDPASGRSRPMRCLRRTDLPPPLRPMMTMISPVATSRSTPAQHRLVAERLAQLLHADHGRATPGRSRRRG